MDYTHKSFILTHELFAFTYNRVDAMEVVYCAESFRNYGGLQL